jgi:hypothetical protein
MRPQILDTLSKRVRGRDVHLVEQQEPPFAALEKLHKLFRGMRPGARVRDHAVYGNDDSCRAVLGAGELEGGVSDGAAWSDGDLPARRIAR